VIQPLGEGGFGRTYEATDADRMDDPCVIKQFVPQVQGTAARQKATELFKQEAKRLYELGEHPQITRLIAYFEQDTRLYLVQEFIEGQTLLAELTQQGVFSEEKIIELLLDVLPVLKFVHERGVIHRDIKPENIMRRRSDGKLILIDFGVSKEVTGTLLSQMGTTVGTPGYAPMEQMHGKAFPASDLYSLGVTCIRLLTHCLPTSSSSNDLYDPIEGSWIWRERLPSGKTISSELGQVLDKMLQPLVKNRYKSADEVLADLADKRHSPSEKQEESNNVSMLGAWYGKFGDGSKPASLIVTEDTGNSFKGILSVRELKLDFTYRLEVDGDFNTEKSSVSIKEQRVISDHWLTDWRIGKNEGTISKDGKKISGGGKDRKDSYSWEFIKIDYNTLAELLSAKKWKEADRETGAILLKISCREKEGRLSSKAIKNLPCPDLGTIDALWLKYSNGRFGLSVQKRIWNETRDWKKCGDSFGWRVNHDWKKYSTLDFTLNARPGAFPTFWGGEGRKLIFGYIGCWEDFFSRISACGL
jgi:serine/threonine protein kinase